MASVAYFVTANRSAAVQKVNGADAWVVAAESSADALALVKSFLGQDCDAWIAAATATAITAQADLEGYVLNIKILHPTTGAIVEEISVTGAASATIDSIGALAVTALNATASIAGAAYATNTLKIAETTDGLGDHRVIAKLIPPAATFANPQAIPGLLGTVTDAGSSGAALSLVMAADAYTFPKLVASVKQTS